MAGSVTLEWNKETKNAYIKLDDGVHTEESTIGAIFADDIIGYKDEEGNFFNKVMYKGFVVAVFRVDPSVFSIKEV